MTRPALIYVSGPITTGGNVPVNVRKGIEAGVRLMDLGFVVIVPHEKTFGAEMLSPRGYEDWMTYDFRCIDVVDAVFRISDWRGTPLPSAGADRECEYARETGKGVYCGEETLLAAYPAGRIDVYPLYSVDVGEGLKCACHGMSVGRPFEWRTRPEGV